MSPEVERNREDVVNEWLEELKKQKERDMAWVERCKTISKPSELPKCTLTARTEEKKDE